MSVSLPPQELKRRLAAAEERGRRAERERLIGLLREVMTPGSEARGAYLSWRLAGDADGNVADYLTAAAPTDGSTDGHD